MTTDPYALPEGLPVPEDDGACDHLPGRALPPLVLESTLGPLDLRALARDRLVLYVYPSTGRPGVPMPTGWDDIPGARGCTPQSCAFRDHESVIRELGARLAGLSAQTREDQAEFAARVAIGYPLLADPGLALADALALPTFEAGGRRLYRRVTLVAERGEIVKVFYPVFPPDRNAADVVAWLRTRDGR